MDKCIRVFRTVWYMYTYFHTRTWVQCVCVRTYDTCAASVHTVRVCGVYTYVLYTRVMCIPEDVGTRVDVVVPWPVYVRVHTYVCVSLCCVVGWGLGPRTGRSPGTRMFTPQRPTRRDAGHPQTGTSSRPFVVLLLSSFPLGREVCE